MKLATMLDDGGLSNQLSEYFCKRISIYFGLMFYILFDFFFTICATTNSVSQVCEGHKGRTE